MGLDMFLRAKKHLSSYSEDGKKLRDEFSTKFGFARYDDGGDPVEISGFVADVAYWRKANAIHRWFVKNAQEGEDNCAEYWVARDKLKELVENCLEALENRDDPESIMPTADGFFFGNLEYNDYYWSEIEWTAKRIGALLEDPALKDFEFYYQSSW